MPEVFSCPKCQRKSRVPDHLLGQLVKCPGCGETFVADLVDAPLPAPTKEDEDRESPDLPITGRREDRDREPDRPRSRLEGEEEVDDRVRRSRRDEEEEDRPGRRSDRFRREDDPGPSAPPTDGFGIASVILGSVSMVMVALGCCSCGLTCYVAAPLALTGGVLGIWAKGGLQAAGLILNILAFLPSVALSVMMIMGVALDSLNPTRRGGFGNPPATNQAPVAPIRNAPRRR